MSKTVASKSVEHCFTFIATSSSHLHVSCYTGNLLPVNYLQQFSLPIKLMSHTNIFETKRKHI